MKLCDSELKNTSQWETAGYEIPKFNRHKIAENTRKNPEWVHFGAGNIFRALTAAAAQKLLNEGLLSTGIIAVGGRDYEVIEKAYRAVDNLSVLVVLKSDGTIQKKVIGSVVDSLGFDPVLSDWLRLKEIFSAKSLKMASFTITEKGYSLRTSAGTFQDSVIQDMKNGPDLPQSTMGKIASLCFTRFQTGAYPLALVSMDNCSHNGTKLFEALEEIVVSWNTNGFVPSSFLDFIRDPSKCSFPWTMIDKITPRPDPEIKKMLEDSGLESTEMIITAKQTYISPFVNAEEAEYLVIEDAFPNGRLPLDKAGVLYTSREIVDKVEKMKVCTCLNPLHTTLAIFGCLLGFTKISEEMKDHDLQHLVEHIAYTEGLPVVVDPGIINPKKFVHEVLTVRLPNPFVPDTPQRIATDSSQKIPVRFGETLKAYAKKGLQNEALSPKHLIYIPFVLAAWCRYLICIDDDGKSFTPSADPALQRLLPVFSTVMLGEERSFHDLLAPILSDKTLFGIDLYELNLGQKVELYFAKMCEGRGAVRQALKDVLTNT